MYFIKNKVWLSLKSWCYLQCCFWIRFSISLLAQFSGPNKRTMDPTPNKLSGSDEIRARSTALTSWNPRGATYEPTLFDQTSYGRYFRLLLPLVQGV